MVQVLLIIISPFRRYVRKQQVAHFLQLFKPKFVQLRCVLFRELE
jgi:hypothetical protein